MNSTYPDHTNHVTTHKSAAHQQAVSMGVTNDF